MVVCCNSQIIIDYCEMLDLPGFYTAKNTLFQGARAKFQEVRLNQLENWLSKQLAYNLHKPVYQTFQIHLMIVYAIDELWQLSKLATNNYGHKFILSINGVLSKHDWILLLKSKHGDKIKEALTKLFNQTKSKQGAGHGTN